MPSTHHELKVLISSYHSLIVIEGAEEERVQRALKSVSRELKIEMVDWSSAQGLKGIALENMEASISAQATLNFLKTYPTPIIVWLKDFARELDNKVVARHLREIVKQFNHTRSTIVITGPQVSLSDELKNLAIKFNFSSPTRDEYMNVIETVYESLSHTHKVKFSLSKEDLSKYLDLLRGLTLQQARQITAQAFLSENSFDGRDLQLIEQRKIQVIKEDGLLEYYPPKANSFELGGFDSLKKWLGKMEAGFSEEARALKLPHPKGVLFVGVPGCGKSLAAKYVARRWRLPLLKLDAGRLYDKFVGESEKNLRRAIRLAEDISPSVLWLDEIEKSISPSGGDSSTDGGVGKRMFGTFLTWLQEKEAPVFVVATANDLHALPPELLRKGRFDEIFFVDLPSSRERTEIFKVHLALRNLGIEDTKLAELVARTDGFSGAEIEQVVVGAGLAAIQERTAISMTLLNAEIHNMIPLSQSRADQIAELRAKAAEFRPAN